MKRIAAAILSVLLLSSTSCGLRNSETSQNEENADVTIEQSAPEITAKAEEEPSGEPTVTADYPYVA
ncbi:MAG: hypothetical protein IKX19_10365, partial [Clostridia bacterium]|nr:hypothetical protein [Clostridia bacterium]